MTSNNISSSRKSKQVDIHVGKRLKQRRMILGLSQTELANRLGISFQQIQKYEKGNNAITTFRLEPLRIALEIPPHKVGYLINKYNPKPKTV